MKKKITFCIIAIMSVFFIFAGCDASNYIGNTQLDSGTSSSNNNRIIDKENLITLDYQSEENNIVDYNYAQIVASNKLNAIVNINCTMTTTYESYNAAGTGFIITSDGYLMTNAHVILCEYKKITETKDKWGHTYYTYTNDIKPYENIYASFQNDSENFYTLSIIAYDKELDLAILKFNNSFQYYTNSTNSTTSSGFQRICEFTNSENLSYGEPVVAIGNAQGYGLSVTAGIISMPLNETFNAIQTNTAINPGNSGGPLFNIKSQVIGITSSKLVNETVENMGYAIPSIEVINYLKTITDYTINYVYET
jgi:S1-C subfamily serine protease